MKKSLIYMLFLFIPMLAFSQAPNEVVRGVVKEKGTGNPMPLVNVVELNENDRIVGGVIADLDGNYYVKIDNPNNRLKFSFVGYESLIVEIDGRSVINVQMEESINTVGEVDIIANKIGRHSDGILNISKAEQTSASVKVELDDIEPMGVTSVGEIIDGRMSGVDISYPSGNPGEGLQIEVRGNTSFDGTSTPPLIVVDGVPYQPPGLDDFDFSDGDSENYATLLDIPVEDILSIEVLKDALSASMYGEDGANGVLLITTRRGEVGAPRVSYRYSSTVNWEPDPIPVLSGPEYVNYQIEKSFNDNDGLSLSIPIQLAYDPNYIFYREYSQDTDWLDEVTRTVMSHNHNVAVSGGGDMARYRISTGYLNQEGTTIGTSYERISTKISLDYDLSKKTRISYDFSYTNGNRMGEYKENKKDPSIRSRAYSKPSNMSVYKFDEDGNLTDDYFTPIGSDNYQGTDQYNYYNPVAMANESYSKNTTDALRTSLNLKTKFGNFDLTTFVVYTFNSSESKAFASQEAFGTDFSDDLSNRSRYGTGQKVNIQHRSTLGFTKSFNMGRIGRWFGGDENSKHTVRSAFFYNIESNNSVSSKGNARNGASTQTQQYFSDNNITGFSSGSSENRKMNFTYTQHYNIVDGKYNVRLSLRYNGNSKMSEDSRWKFLYGYGAGWNFYKENWLKNVKWLKNGKLRYSFAHNSNFPDDNAYYGTFAQDVDYNSINSTKQEKLQLDDLTYENTYQHDIGLELGIGSRWNIEADYYRKKTTDKITKDQRNPGSTGYTKLARVNFGGVINEGIELSTRYQLIRNKVWKASVRFNVSRNRNRLTQLPEGYTRTAGNMRNNGDYFRQLVVGQPTGGIYGYKSLGVYSTVDETYLRDDNGNLIYGNDVDPKRMRFGDENGYIFQAGDARYADLNADGVINEKDVVYLGKARPLVFGGFGFSISYKSLKISTGWTYNFGKDVINQRRINLESMNGKGNMATSVRRRWRIPGDVTDIPRAYSGSGGRNYLGSDRFVEKADFVRLNNVSINYNVPKKYCLGFKSVNIHGSVKNLLTITDYSGMNPNVGSNNGGWSDVGKDKATTPPPKNFSFGVNIGF